MAKEEPACSSSTQRYATDRFKRLDSDRSGGVDRKELKAALTSQKLPCSDKDIESFFAKADTNKDGLVSEAEFIWFVQKQESALHRFHESVDTNRDGRLSADEIRKGATALGFKLSGAQIRSFMQRADENHDGVLSFEELRAFLLLLPAVNPDAVFEAIGAELIVEHATGEATPPMELAAACKGASGTLFGALVSKLYSGGVAGAVSRTLTAPIDRVKMVMQAQPAGAANEGMVATATRIFREGGVPAFFRGNNVNVLKIAPETGVKFLAFDILKSALAKDKSNPTVSERFVAGGGAGAVAQSIVYPLEVVKTRLAVSAAGTYAGLSDCFRSVLRNEGATSLYRGLGASIIGIVPYAGVDLSVNSVLKDCASRVYALKGEEPGVAVVLGCGMVSSTVAMLCTYPLNLVRTRLQMVGMHGAPHYDGAIDCFRKTIQGGGLRALYQGIVPNLVKVLPATSISYAVYDALKART